MNATLPDVWVRAHPFGDTANQDSHREHFDHRTKFYDDLLPTVPASHYHNFDEQGNPVGEPIAVGVTVERAYANPETGVQDGRWDKIRFFDKAKIPADVYTDLAQAIEKRNLRASPTVVPDFHKVGRDGHISHWLTGSIAIFGAKGRMQPANQRAIGMAAMKSLFKAADLEFPNLEGVTMAENTRDNWMGFVRTQFDNFMKALAAKPTEAKEDLDEWEKLFGPELEDEDETEEGKKKDKEKPTMADSPNADELQIKYEKQENQMKAVLAQNAELARRLDEKDMSTWFDGVLQLGKVLPAEKDAIVGMALQLKQDDDAQHPTMKSADGKETTRLNAFKALIEQRAPIIANIDPSKLHLLKMENGGEKKEEKPSQERTDELLAMTAEGRAAIEARKSANGNH